MYNMIFVYYTYGEWNDRFIVEQLETSNLRQMAQFPLAPKVS